MSLFIVYHDGSLEAMTVKQLQEKIFQISEDYKKILPENFKGNCFHRNFAQKKAMKKLVKKHYIFMIENIQHFEFIAYLDDILYLKDITADGYICLYPENDSLFSYEGLYVNICGKKDNMKFYINDLIHVKAIVKVVFSVKNGRFTMAFNKRKKNITDDITLIYSEDTVSGNIHNCSA